MPYILEFALDDVRKRREFCLEVVSRREHMLKYVHADYLKDLDDFALKSIALKLSVICHHWERNYIDMKFILRCISLNFEVLNYIFNKLKNEFLFLLGDEEFMNLQLPF